MATVKEIAEQFEAVITEELAQDDARREFLERMATKLGATPRGRAFAQEVVAVDLRKVNAEAKLAAVRDIIAEEGGSK